MFGYVKIHKPELKVAEYDTYKAIYCSLCRSLGKKYGHILRMTLSYDFTFLAMLALSLQETPCSFKKSNCVYNPFKKCYYNTNYGNVIDKVSAIATLMVYFKLLDNIKDERGFKRLGYKFARFFLNAKMKKAKNDLPEAYKIISELNQKQNQVEADDNINIDLACEPSAVALGKLCQIFKVTDVDGDRLYRIGYCVGKWVYLMDALEDREDDLKIGRFNPLSGSDEETIATMNVCSNEAGAIFETLPTLYYEGIIRNILYLGMPRQIEVFKQKKGELSDDGSL